MSLLSQKRSTMTLFSNKDDFFSHQVRIVLEEKGIIYSIEEVDPKSPLESLAEINPYQTVPTLMDRDLVLYDSLIIMEYLDERFPHPPLMPVYPVARAHCRLLMHRLKSDWYDVYVRSEELETTAEKKDAIVRKILAQLKSMLQIFDVFEFFMSEEFSLVDAYWAPLLWELSKINALPTKEDFPKFDIYKNKLFKRPSFIKSLQGGQEA